MFQTQICTLRTQVWHVSQRDKEQHVCHFYQLPLFSTELIQFFRLIIEILQQVSVPRLPKYSMAILYHRRRSGMSFFKFWGSNLSQYLKYIVKEWFWKCQLPSVREKKVASTAMALFYWKHPSLLQMGVQTDFPLKLSFPAQTQSVLY